MPNQINPTRRRVSVELPISEKTSVREYAHSKGLTLADFAREAAYRVRNGMLNNASIQLCSHINYKGFVFICDKEDYQAISRYAKEWRVNASVLIRAGFHAVWEELNSVNKIDMQRPVDE